MWNIFSVLLQAKPSQVYRTLTSKTLELLEGAVTYWKKNSEVPNNQGNSSLLDSFLNRPASFTVDCLAWFIGPEEQGEQLPGKLCSHWHFCNKSGTDERLCNYLKGRYLWILCPWLKISVKNRGWPCSVRQMKAVLWRAPQTPVGG